MPPRRAARTLSRTPPTGSTRPRRVICLFSVVFGRCSERGREVPQGGGRAWRAGVRRGARGRGMHDPGDTVEAGAPT